MGFCLVAWILVTLAATARTVPDYTVILLPGNTIVPPKEYPSPSGAFKLILNTKKLAVVQTCDGKEVWNTHAHTSDVTKLTLKDDGDLWLYGDPIAKTDALLWETGTSGSRFVNPRLTLSDDGFVRLYSGERCYWESANVIEQGCLTTTSGNIKQTTLLASGESVQVGMPYYSPNRAYKMQLQRDGNLVVYRECDGIGVFSTYTYSTQSAVTNATLSPNGNFALYGTMRAKWYGPIWFAEPWKGDGIGQQRMVGSELRLSNDGFLYQCKGTYCFWRSGYFHDMTDSTCAPVKDQPAKAEKVTSGTFHSTVSASLLVVLVFLLCAF